MGESRQLFQAGFDLSHLGCVISILLNELLENAVGLFVVRHGLLELSLNLIESAEITQNHRQVREVNRRVLRDQVPIYFQGLLKMLAGIIHPILSDIKESENSTASLQAEGCKCSDFVVRVPG